MIVTTDDGVKLVLAISYEELKFKFQNGYNEFAELDTAGNLYRVFLDGDRIMTELEEPMKRANKSSCHYCGQLATDFGFFDEPICPQCGG